MGRAKAVLTVLILLVATATAKQVSKRGHTCEAGAKKDIVCKGKTELADFLACECYLSMDDKPADGESYCQYAFPLLYFQPFPSVICQLSQLCNFSFS